MSALMGGQCAACGHKPADHAEGWMGATIDGTPYCHVDDHSCYVAASRALTVGRHRLGFEVLNTEP